MGHSKAKSPKSQRKACTEKWHADPHLLPEALQHAVSPKARLRHLPPFGSGVSHVFSPTGHWHGLESVHYRPNASTFLRPLAPQALPRILATTGALTPVRPALRGLEAIEHRPFAGQVSLVHTARPSPHSATNHLTRPAIAFTMPVQRDGPAGSRSHWPVSSSGLRQSLVGSSQRPAASCSSSCGLRVCLRLLSTPPRGDAVTIGYRERASPGGGLSPPRSRLLPGALGGGVAPADLPHHRTYGSVSGGSDIQLGQTNRGKQ